MWRSSSVGCSCHIHVMLRLEIKPPLLEQIYLSFPFIREFGMCELEFDCGYVCCECERETERERDKERVCVCVSMAVRTVSLVITTSQCIWLRCSLPGTVRLFYHTIHTLSSSPLCINKTRAASVFLFTHPLQSTNTQQYRGSY